MKASSYFSDLVAAIQLPDDLRQAAQKAHTDLRALLENDDDLKQIVTTTFLQGSYKRHTGTKPAKGENADVDVVAVTTINRAQTAPGVALNTFKPFLEKHYKGRYRPQGRSWGITVGKIDLDLVPTSAPGQATQLILKEAASSKFFDELGVDGGVDLGRLQELRKAATPEKWRPDALWIPDREAKIWRETNPIAQIDATVDKNDATNGCYLGTVKLIKWWRRIAYAGKHPKGYPLEHITWMNCPDGIESLAEGFTRTAESVVRAYKADRATQRVPSLQDHGVRSHNVLARLSPEDFAAFFDEVVVVAKAARAALDEPDLEKSVRQWRAIFGPEFPETPKYSERKAVTSVVPGRFA